MLGVFIVLETSRNGRLTIIRFHIGIEISVPLTSVLFKLMNLHLFFKKNAILVDL